RWPRACVERVGHRPTSDELPKDRGVISTAVLDCQDTAESHYMRAGDCLQTRYPSGEPLVRGRCHDDLENLVLASSTNPPDIPLRAIAQVLELVDRPKRGTNGSLWNPGHLADGRRHILRPVTHLERWTGFSAPQRSVIRMGGRRSGAIGFSGMSRPDSRAFFLASRREKTTSAPLFALQTETTLSVG